MGRVKRCLLGLLAPTSFGESRGATFEGKKDMGKEKYYDAIPVESTDVEVVEAEKKRKNRRYTPTDRLAPKKRFASPTTMTQAINEYFEDCAKCEPMLDKDGNPMLYKGEPVWKTPPTPPTTTGLALALGFTNRQSLVDFCKKDKVSQENDVRSTSGEDYTLVYDTDEFRDVILRAYAICENYMEKQLYNKDTATGAKFALSNADKRWSDKAGLDLTLKTSEDHISAEEAQKRLQALGFIQTPVKKDKGEKEEKSEK